MTVQPIAPPRNVKVLLDERIERAIRALHAAAGDVNDAAEEARSAAKELWPPARPGSRAELEAAVRRYHDEHHTEPIRWCAEMCRLAEVD